MHARPYTTAAQRPSQHPNPNRPISPPDPLQRPRTGAPLSPLSLSHDTPPEPLPLALASGSATTTIGTEPSYPPPPYTQAVQQQIFRHQRMLLFLRHCAKCSDPVACRYGWRCESGKELWKHIFSCGNPRCTFPNCVQARELLRHYQKCHDSGCPICGPVRGFLASPQGQAGGLPANMT